jgi:hypothetical protein
MQTHGQSQEHEYHFTTLLRGDDNHRLRTW